MPNLSISSSDRLADFLHRFVDVIRRDSGYTWDLLVRTTKGRVGTIEFDGHRLQLGTEGADDYHLVTSAAEPDAPLNFRTDAATVRDLIAGQETLDRALVSGRVFVRGSLDDLLSMYQLVMNVLADAPRNAAIRRLFHEFEATWPGEAAAVRPIEAQAARHGYLISQIPASVLRIDVEH